MKTSNKIFIGVLSIVVLICMVLILVARFNMEKKGGKLNSTGEMMEEGRELPAFSELALRKSFGT